jgi:predicted nuclease of predicted toxin-antitoxin system
VRFLADAGVSPKTFEFLHRLGHDAVHVRALRLERATDREIAQRAAADHRIIVTFDLDFGEVLALGTLDKPSVILCRLADERFDSVNLHRPLGRYCVN